MGASQGKPGFGEWALDWVAVLRNQESGARLASASVRGLGCVILWIAVNGGR